MAFAKDLRAAVLQAAMQGKLTEQLATDTPVSELLSDIKAEKDRLITEKKIKKEKPLSAISEDDIPFDIPESWEWVKLGNLSFITSGGTPSRSNPRFWNGDIPWVKIGDMSSKYLNETEEKISQEGLENSSAKYFNKGTILYSIFASIGTVSILNIKATTNQAIAGIVPHGNIDIDYLYYILVALKDVLVKQGRGCAQLNINQEILKNTPLPIPPIEEQKRIVRRIEEIMKHIDELEAIEEELKKLKETFPADMKAAVLQAAMQGKLTEQLETDSSVDDLLEDIKKEREKLVKEGKIKKSKTQNNNFVQLKDGEEPFEIPDNWRWVRVKDCFDVKNGFTPLRSNDEFWRNGNIPWFTVEDIHNQGKIITKTAQHITEKAISKKSNRIIPSNTVLLCCTGATIGNYAFTTISLTTNQQFNALVVRGEFFEKINPFFVFHWVATLKSEVQKIAKSTTFPFLSVDKLNNFAFPLPPLEEQNRIVAKLEQILPLIADLS